MEWWVFPALVLCAVTFTAAAGVLVFLAARGVWRLLARYEPTHALAPSGERWVPWGTDPRFGSMQLEDDCAWEVMPFARHADRNPIRVTEAGARDWREVAHEGDWRAQTAADLAPAALDSGPGGPSLAPGPDQDGGGGVPGSGHEPVQLTLPPRPPEPDPVRTVAGRLVETSDEWLRRLAANAAPGWTYAGVAA